MIEIDTRFLRWVSKRFADKFGGLAYITTLKYGDMVFWGADDAFPCCEVKAPRDLVSSIRHTGRLIQQFRQAAQVHSHYFLFVLGEVGVDPDGYYAEWRWDSGEKKHRWQPVPIPGTNPPKYLMYREVENFLNTMNLIDGVVVKEARNEDVLVARLISLYWWFQKPMEAHRSTAADRFYKPVWMPQEMSLRRRVAKELPKIGIAKSRAAEKVFGNTLDMIRGTEKEWMKVEGVGREIARQVVKEIEKW
mgnify:FL=1